MRENSNYSPLQCKGSVLVVCLGMITMLDRSSLRGSLWLMVSEGFSPSRQKKHNTAALLEQMQCLAEAVHIMADQEAEKDRKRGQVFKGHP